MFLPGRHEPGQVIQVGVFEIQVRGDGDEGRVADYVDDSSGAILARGGCHGREEGLGQ